MGMHHHHESKNNEQDFMRRFMEQMNGTARREWPAGRMGAEDDGSLAYAVAADPRHRTIVIRFGKLVEWIGLGIEDAEALRDKLLEKIVELRAGTPAAAPKQES